jgi:phosphoglycolate phosphatase
LKRAAPVLEAVLFDLDGVLIDSVASIGASMTHALEAMGRPARPPEVMRRFVGPQLEESAARLLGTEDPEQIARWITAYRMHYDVHCVEQTTPAEGLLEVIEGLAARVPLAVATSKPEVYAERLLKAFGVRPHFRALCGRSLKLDREGKAQVIARALAALGLAGGPRVLMVGDREHDVLGARAHGIPAIGVLHGAGDATELEAAGARWVVPDLRAAGRLIHAVLDGRSAP